MSYIVHDITSDLLMITLICSKWIAHGSLEDRCSVLRIHGRLSVCLKHWQVDLLAVVHSPKTVKYTDLIHMIGLYWGSNPMSHNPHTTQISYHWDSWQFHEKCLFTLKVMMGKCQTHFKTLILTLKVRIEMLTFTLQIAFCRLNENTFFTNVF